MSGYAIDPENVVVSGAVTIPTPVPVTDNNGSLTVDGAVTIPVPVPVTDNSGSLTVDGTVTANQGTPAATANRWPVQITDGTNLGVLVSPSEPAATAAWAEKGLRVLIGPTDRISNIPVVLLYDHHQLHEGEIFRWSYVNTAGLNTGSSEYMVFTVPNITIPSGFNEVTLCPHLRWEVVTDSYAQAFLYEGPTVTGGTGTSRTPIAMERNGTYTPKLTILEKPTVTVDGTLLWQGLLFTTKNSAGSSASADTEFVLKNNTKYAFKFTSGTNGCKFLLRFVWYEDLGV